MRTAFIVCFVATMLQSTAGRCETAVPENLAPPLEMKLAFVGHATGVQIYVCQAAASGAPKAWVLLAPEATLTDASNKPLATHFGGPTWQAQDGSQVKGKALAQAVPDPESIPWLLISVVEHKGSGLMTPVTYIQRLHTQGGKAPVGGCDTSTLGKKAPVPYSADYYFYSRRE